jgi:hypothetical protein
LYHDVSTASEQSATSIALQRVHQEFVLPLFENYNTKDSDAGIFPIRWMNVVQALDISKDLPGRPVLLALSPFFNSGTMLLVPALLELLGNTEFHIDH